MDLKFFNANRILLEANFLNSEIYKPSLGTSSTQNLGDRFSHFDVYWIQTNKKHQNRQTDKHVVNALLHKGFLNLYLSKNNSASISYQWLNPVTIL